MSERDVLIGLKRVSVDPSCGTRDTNRTGRCCGPRRAAQVHTHLGLQLRGVGHRLGAREVAGSDRVTDAAHADGPGPGLASQLGALDVRDEQLVGGACGWVEELGELSAALPDAGARGVAAKP